MTHPFFPGGFTSIGISELNRAGLQVRAYDVTDPATGAVTRVTSPDPGRMLISGKASDANFFDPTQLRGIRKTAPYFHDNSAATLLDVLNHYNLLFTVTNTPTVPTAEFNGLIAYLNRL
ncbi:MAG TPA: hypothetical protein VFS43_07325, partial [Polyangiaceae bacterium]|nr:hypothetical protein [Polyangiaceae bacterium]